MLHDESNSFYNLQSPYENFIRHHLKHYGYFTKKKRNIYGELEGYPRDRDLGSDEDEEEKLDNDEMKDEKKIESLGFRTTQIILKDQENGKITRTLKDPLQLDFTINFQQKPRWPIEMEVLNDTVTFIREVNNKREPLYKRTGKEFRPQPHGEDDGELIFDYKIFPSPFFMRSKSAPSNNSEADISISVDPKHNVLIFESRFECGNLEKVYKVGQYEYELHLRPDLYTGKHTQWFYFQVRNMKSGPDITYRFSIVNLYKSESLYNNGLRPLMYSTTDARNHNKGWRRFGSNICYYRNNRRNETAKGIKYYYSLTWTMEFPYNNDTIFIAHCYPYTYTDMMKYVQDITEHPIKSKICQVKVLAQSLANNPVPLLTITNQSNNREIERKKRIVVITSRVHPGETNASWMMEGVLDNLLSDRPDSKLLRDIFIFKVVPMLNPDGVIVGNYRCSLTGRDLNRNYLSLLKSSYPIIFRLRNMIESMQQEREVFVYCDLHGHSRRQNIFLYGNGNQKTERDFLLERALPMLISKNASDKFCYDYCRFKMQKSKAGTSRIAFRKIGIPHSFTIEASFCGSTLTPDSNVPLSSTNNNNNNNNNSQYYHFNTHDLKMLGESFCNALLDFMDPDKTNLEKLLEIIKSKLTSKYISNLESKGINVNTINISSINVANLPESDIESSDEEDDNGSDSSDSNGLPVDLDYVQKQLKLTKLSKSNRTSKESSMTNKSSDNTCLRSGKHNSKQSNSTTPPLTKTSSILPKQKLISPESKYLRKSPKIKSKIQFNTKSPIDQSESRNETTIKKNNLDLNESGKKYIQEMETKKVLLQYSGTKLSREQNKPALSSENSDLDNKSNKQKLNIQQPGTSIENQTLSVSNLNNQHRSGSSLASNSFQVLSFSPHTDLDPRQKSFHSFYQNHTEMNRRVQALSLNSGMNNNNRRRSSQKESKNKANSGPTFNLTLTSIK